MASKPSETTDDVVVVVTSYRYRVEPTKAQEAYLHRCAAAQRMTYNHFLGIRKHPGKRHVKCGKKTDGRRCQLPWFHEGQCDGRSRCDGTAEIPRGGPCCYLPGHSGPCRALRPPWPPGKNKLIKATNLSATLTVHKDELKFRSRDAQGVWRSYTYAAVAAHIAFEAEHHVEAANNVFWAHIKNGRFTAQPPRFKSARRSPVSFKMRSTHAKAKVPPCSDSKWAYVWLEQPASKQFKVDEWYKIRLHRPLPADATVSDQHWSFDKADGHWYVSLVCKQTVERPTSRSPVIIGIDRGSVVRAAAYGIDEQTEQVVVDRLYMPPDSEARQRRIRELLKVERKLAELHHLQSPKCFIDGRHRKNGCLWQKSKRVRRLFERQAKLRAELARVERENTEIITHDLVQGACDQPAAGVVAFEGLQVVAMTASNRGTVENPGTRVAQKTGMNREFLRAQPARMIERVEQKAKRAALEGRAVDVVTVPARNTSLRCPGCGHTDKLNRPNQATFRCVKCGYLDNADRVGAINVLTRARALASEQS